MMCYVNLIQTCVRCKIELISILCINCCIRSAFAIVNLALHAPCYVLWAPGKMVLGASVRFLGIGWSD